ncbi:YraN family protein [Porticoccus sp. W117]|uniref:YraN family protein n=1 Tax=Porticoccus sp. W117 TaxID=3054777 RepID=UPI002594019F|nr:YraN family protein [Porticoccus sp. W117]MDM3870935.1 YraN family protein [Porticoccus sp. W117]
MDGDKAEQLARRHLKKAGLTIIECNYRCRRGEIDIIARDGDSLVFVEVRYRRQNSFGSAADSINQRKQARITTAALSYLQRHQLGETLPCRFDTICIAPNPANGLWRQAYHIDWLRNAFQANQ